MIELITDIKLLNRAIGTFTKSVMNIDAKSHMLAVSSIVHALDNSNNWTPLTNLVKGMGGYDEVTNKFKSRSVRSKDMRNWVTANLPVSWVHINGQGRYKTNAKKMAQFDRVACEAAIQTPWYDAVKEQSGEIKVTTMEDRTKAYIKHIKADMKKALENGIDYKTEVNDKLVEELLALVNFHAILEAEPVAANEAGEPTEDMLNAQVSSAN